MALCWSCADPSTHLLEVREHVLPAPSGVSKCLPGIVVGAGTPGCDDAVEDAAATNHMALPVVSSVVVQKLLGGGREVPVVGGRKAVADQSRDGDDVGGRVPVVC